MRTGGVKESKNLEVRPGLLELLRNGSTRQDMNPRTSNQDILSGTNHFLENLDYLFLKLMDKTVGWPSNTVGADKLQRYEFRKRYGYDPETEDPGSFWGY